ncbi:hypothetical protein KC315_g15294 [Hortaea werneckii]|nr:hypothetical protein KC315_g15294 [Hortaea werneckii]
MIPTVQDLTWNSSNVLLNLFPTSSSIASALTTSDCLKQHFPVLVYNSSRLHCTELHRPRPNFQFLEVKPPDLSIPPTAPNMPLSQKQMEYLALAWQCFETEPKSQTLEHTKLTIALQLGMEFSQIDYNKFYQIAHLASANSARELMRVTKKKLKEEYGALAATTSGDPPGTPRSSTNTNTPKKAGKATGRNGGLSSAAGTPSAAGKKRGRKPKGFEGRGGEDVDDEEEEEEGSPLKKGKMGGLVEVKREKNSVEEEDDEEEESILQ